MSGSPRTLKSRAWSGQSMLAGVRGSRRVKMELPNDIEGLEKTVQDRCTAQMCWNAMSIRLACCILTAMRIYDSGFKRRMQRGNVSRPLVIPLAF